MPSVERIDSPNPAVKAIERWKRGVVVTVIFVLGLIPGILAGGLVSLGAELLGAGLWSYVVGAIAILVIAPWGLGQRFVLREIGKLAKAPDN